MSFDVRTKRSESSASSANDLLCKTGSVEQKSGEYRAHSPVSTCKRFSKYNVLGAKQ